MSALFIISSTFCPFVLLNTPQVSNWSQKQPTNKRTSKSSLHRPLDLDTPTSEESSSSFDQLSIPSFKVRNKFYIDSVCVFLCVTVCVCSSVEYPEVLTLSLML